MTVLVLSFYDDSSIGDDAFKMSFSKMSSGMNLQTRFQDIRDFDDGRNLPRDVDMVFTNLIDDTSFREKATELIDRTTIPFYGISTDHAKGGGGGVAAAGDNKEIDRNYLRLFDHIVVRSKRGYDELVQFVGEANLTYVPDIIIGFEPRKRPQQIYHFPLRTRQLCLVIPPQELLRRDPQFLSGLVRCASDVASSMRSRLCIIVLNTGKDDKVNEHVVSMIERSRHVMGSGSVYALPVVDSVQKARRVISRTVGCVAMGYYALLFAVQESVPVFALHSARDEYTRHLADDVSLSSSYRHEFDPDDDIQSICEAVNEKMKHAFRKRSSGPSGKREGNAYDISRLIRAFNVGSNQLMRSVVSKRGAVRDLELSRPLYPRPYQSYHEAQDLSGLHDHVINAIARLTSSSPQDVAHWYYETNDDNNDRKGLPIARISSGTRVISVTTSDVALCVSFTITGTLASSFYLRAIELAITNRGNNNDYSVQKLVEQMVRDLQKKDTKLLHESRIPLNSEWVTLPLRSSATLLDIDKSSSMDDAESFVSTGWILATTGLRYMSPQAQGRSRAPSLRFDAYVDRTFMWGKRSLQATGSQPFTTVNKENLGKESTEPIRWAGIVHHTFDTRFDEHNCMRLVEDTDFHAALKSCVLLLTTSHATSVRMKRELQARLPSSEVPAVESVTVPTSLSFPESFTFTMSKFRDNPDRMLVHIGVWMRNMYSIYDLKQFKNAPVKKAILRQKFDDMYYPISENVFNRMHKFAREYETLIIPLNNSLDGGRPCRPGAPCRPCRPCRPEENGNCYKKNYQEFDDIVNKFVRGMFDAVTKAISSVKEIHLSGGENEMTVSRASRATAASYNDLLSKNAVFLHLVDASSVDVIQECIVRRTPVFVNRLPSLEEVLGKDYPGFYSSLEEAGVMTSDWNYYGMCHDYLKRIDIDKFSNASFLQKINDHLTQLQP